MKSYNSEIGKWLANKREQKGLSQQDIAERMNCTKTAVHYWETGKRKIFAEIMIEYCMILGVDPQDLVKEVMHDARL